MSQINVNRIKDSNKGAPDFPSGVNVGGITSTVTLGVTNLNPTNLNVSGVVTATTLDGNLLSTGTPTLGLGVTINTSGVNISGVATAGIVSATTLYGDGTNITGIALTIAPLNYNPAVLGSEVAKTSGIGITFNQGVKAGSGNVTLSIANAGVAGTVVENFGVGNSVSYSNGDTITITPTSSLNASETYHLSYPSGAFTNTGGDVSYVGTAYTFGVKAPLQQLWVWGSNTTGKLGLSESVNSHKSSPVQIPGVNWEQVTIGGSKGWQKGATAMKSDGSLWVWGFNYNGFFGLNGTAIAPQSYTSSPVQVPGTWKSASGSYGTMVASKTNGTLWSWGYNAEGYLGQNNKTNYSSPVQIGGGTDWTGTKDTIRVNRRTSYAIKTDGTLWAWGFNTGGRIGDNSLTHRSSPVQIPGTTWAKVQGGEDKMAAIKTDGTLWMWGYNNYGELGQNEGANSHKSSPVQIPGTTWRQVNSSQTAAAIKTDNTLWMWGRNEAGELGQNQASAQLGGVSSPVQIPGTTWNKVDTGNDHIIATKTDGTLWTWGYNQNGELGHNNRTLYSSPVQVPGTNWTSDLGVAKDTTYVIKVV